MSTASSEISVVLDAFRSSMEERFDKMDGRIDKMDGRLDKMDGRLDKMDGRLDKMDGRLDRIEARLDGMDARIDKMDGRLDRIEARLDGMDARISELAEIVAQLASETRVLERTVVNLSSAMTEGFNQVALEISGLRTRLHEILATSMEGRTLHSDQIGSLKERLTRLERVVAELNKPS